VQSCLAYRPAALGFHRLRHLVAPASVYAGWGRVHLSDSGNEHRFPYSTGVLEYRAIQKGPPLDRARITHFIWPVKRMHVSSKGLPTTSAELRGYGSLSGLIPLRSGTEACIQSWMGAYCARRSAISPIVQSWPISMMTIGGIPHISGRCWPQFANIIGHGLTAGTWTRKRANRSVLMNGNQSVPGKGYFQKMGGSGSIELPVDDNGSTSWFAEPILRFLVPALKGIPAGYLADRHVFHYLHTNYRGATDRRRYVLLY